MLTASRGETPLRNRFLDPTGSRTAVALLEGSSMEYLRLFVRRVIQVA